MGKSETGHPAQRTDAGGFVTPDFTRLYGALEFLRAIAWVLPTMAGWAGPLISARFAHSAHLASLHSKLPPAHFLWLLSPLLHLNSLTKRCP